MSYPKGMHGQGNFFQTHVEFVLESVGTGRHCVQYMYIFLTPTWYFNNSKPCFWILELVNVLSMHSGFIQNIHQFSYAKIFEGR